MSKHATSKIKDEVLAANAIYASDFGDKAKLALPPARRFAILTCMDARIDPAKLAGLREGDAHVILDGRPRGALGRGLGTHRGPQAHGCAWVRTSRALCRPVASAARHRRRAQGPPRVKSGPLPENRRCAGYTFISRRWRGIRGVTSP